MKTISEFSNCSDGKNELQLIRDFFLSQQNCDFDRSIENYHPNFANSPGNFFNIVSKGRFENGRYYVAHEDGAFVCSAGWNKHTDTTALILVRAFTNPMYRGRFYLNELILPRILQDTEHFDKLWITFNKYNKRLYDVFCRFNQTSKRSIITWPSVYANFKPIGMKIINYTEHS